MSRLPGPLQKASRPRSRKRGYILLMTLLVLVLCVSTLAGVCRMSMAKAARSRADVEELQRRWGTLSCRSNLLPRAQAVLSAREEITGRPIAQFSTTVVLTDQAFELTFADEQSKSNINRAVELEQAARAAARSLSKSSLAVALHPVRRRLSDGAGRTETLNRYESFGQVFREPSGAQCLTLSDQLTCWGDGRLNWRRATPAAIAVACRQVGEPRVVAALIAARSVTPPPSLSQALAGISLSPEKAKALDEAMSTGSTCHSLWVVAAPVRKSAGAEHYAFSVLTTDDQDGPVVEDFVW
jgi:hypothetical protein